MDDNDQHDTGFLGKLKHFFDDAFDEAAGKFVGDALPLGHGAALSYPDRTYLKWNYEDSHGNIVRRDNAKDFSEAANEMCKAMQRYRVRNPEANVPGLPVNDSDKITNLLSSIKDEDRHDYHRKWLRVIRNGDFSFPPVKLEYKAKGVDPGNTRP